MDSVSLVHVVTIFLLTPVFVAYASEFEWQLHVKFMHRKQRIYPKAYETHAQEHHVVFRACESYHLQDERDRHKIGMAWLYGLIVVVIAWVPVCGISFLVFLTTKTHGLFLILVNLEAIFVFKGMFALYTYTHECMHDPKGRWFEQTRWYQKRNGHHLLHHRYPGKANFNTVVLWADWWHGTLMTVSPRDFEQAGAPTPSVQPR